MYRTTFTRLPDKHFPEFKEIVKAKNIDSNLYRFEEKVQSELSAQFNYYYRRQVQFENEQYYINYGLCLEWLPSIFNEVFDNDEEKKIGKSTSLQFSLFPNLPILDSFRDGFEIIIRGQNKSIHSYSGFNYLTYENILRINDYLEGSKVFKKDYIIPRLKEINKSKYWGKKEKSKSIEEQIWYINDREWREFKYDNRNLPKIFDELISLKNFYNECSKFKNCWVLISWR